MAERQDYVVVPVKWLSGIQAVVVADRVYVARQKTPELTKLLAKFVLLKMHNGG